MPTNLTRRSLIAGAALAAQGADVLPKLPQKVRLAMIGLEGHISEITEALRSSPDLELVAMSDPEPRQMARLARAPFGSKAKQYQDWRQLLDREKLDMVATCGVNGERAAIVLACAARKLNVVAEKPLATEKADLERIRTAVQRTGIRLSMLLPMRFSAPYLALKQIVDSGQVGEVSQISAQKSYKVEERPEWMKHHASFGGTIPYIGIHMVDLMRWASGREMVEAASFQGRVGYPELRDMENTTGTVFRLDNGGVGTLHMDYLRPEGAPTHGDDRLRLAGTDGVAEYQAATGVTVMTRKEKPRTLTELPKSRSLFVDFLESVYLGKPVGLTQEDIFRVNEIVLGARESAETRRFVKL